MRLRATVLGIVVALAVAGCGNSRHAALTRYVKQVNAVTSGLRVQLGQVAAANQRFATHGKLDVLTPQLAASRRTLRTLGAQLSALDAPPEAKPLAATLAKLVALERSLVDEMYRFTVFLPAFQAAIVPADRAVASFQRAARAAKTAPAEAAATTTYAVALSRPIAALARLSPPAVLRPAYVSEVNVLRSTRATVHALTAALRARQTTKVHDLVVRLALVARGNGTLATQRAEIAAVSAYDAKVLEIGRLENHAQQQLTRLQK